MLLRTRRVATPALLEEPDRTSGRYAPRAPHPEISHPQVSSIARGRATKGITTIGAHEHMSPSMSTMSCDKSHPRTVGHALIHVRIEEVGVPIGDGSEFPAGEVAAGPALARPWSPHPGPVMAGRQRAGFGPTVGVRPTAGAARSCVTG